MINDSHTLTHDEKCDQKEESILCALRSFRTQKPGTALYDRDKDKLINLLCEYVFDFDRFIWAEVKKAGLANYGLEIFEVALDCILYYKGETEKFLEYFNFSLNNRLFRAIGLSVYDDIHGGIKSIMTQEDRTELYKYKPVSYDNDDYTDIHDLENCTDAENKFWGLLGNRNITVVDVEELWYGIYHFTGETDDDGDSTDPFSNIVSNSDSDNVISVYEGCATIMDKINSFYNSQQDRSKYKYSLILTAKCIEIADSVQGLMDYLSMQDFYSEEIHNYYMENSKAPSMKWVAMKLGVAEAEISRCNTLVKNSLGK